MSTTTTTTVHGEVCYGQDSGVEEENIRDITGNWVGNASITGSGDTEALSFEVGQYKKLDSPWYLGVGQCELELNKYRSGSEVDIYYRTGSSIPVTLGSGWSAYSGAFSSQGFVDVWLGRSRAPFSTTTTYTGSTTSTLTTTTTIYVAPTTHRYWRVRCIFDSDYSDYLGMGELELRTEVSGSQAATGGTAIASDYVNSSYMPVEAFNGVYSTTDEGDAWISSSKKEGWIGYDFGEGNEVDIVEFAVWPRHGHPDQIPQTLILEYSDDDSTWEPKFAGYDVSATNDTLSVFTHSSYPKYLLRVDDMSASWESSSQKYCVIAEIELHDEVDGSNIVSTSNCDACANSFLDAARMPKYIIDGVVDQTTSGCWHSALGTSEDEYWVLLEPTEDINDIVEYSLTARPSATPDANITMPIGWRLQKWNNSTSEWETIDTVTGEDEWSASETRTYSIQQPLELIGGGYLELIGGGTLDLEE